MSTWYVSCQYCGYEIGSAQEMIVLKECEDGILEAAHPECMPTSVRFETVISATTR